MTDPTPDADATPQLPVVEACVQPDYEILQDIEHARRIVSQTDFFPNGETVLTVFEELSARRRATKRDSELQEIKAMVAGLGGISLPTDLSEPPMEDDLDAQFPRVVHEAVGLRVRADPREENPGGSSHVYTLDEGAQAEDFASYFATLALQRGPLLATGRNGWTTETLLAVLIDHLGGFQAGKYACEENGLAIEHLEAAKALMEHRTAKRKARGVEGTMEV